MQLQKVKSLQELNKLTSNLKNYTFIAGGVDIQDRMNEGTHFENLIDISKIKDLRGIKVENNIVSIGALTTIAELIEDKSELPDGFKKGISEIATPQIRNVATVGGNLMQKPKHITKIYPSTIGLMLMAHKAKVKLANGNLLKIEDTIKHRFKGLITKVEFNKSNKKTSYFRLIERTQAEWPIVELYKIESNENVIIYIGAISQKPFYITISKQETENSIKKLVNKEINEQNLNLKTYILDSLVGTIKHISKETNKHEKH